MSVFPPSEYKFIKFKKSNTKNKKYDAILMNKKTNRKKTISFGDKRFEQYKDSTNLKLYKNLNHLDQNRRKNYWARHAEEGNINRKYSAGWFSWWFLWAPDNVNPNNKL